MWLPYIIVQLFSVLHLLYNARNTAIVHDFDVERAEKILRTVRIKFTGHNLQHNLFQSSGLMITYWWKTIKSLAWRKKYGVDEILTTYKPPETVMNYFSLGHVGVDKFGCPG